MSCANNYNLSMANFKTRNLNQSEELMDVDISMNSHDSSFHHDHAASPHTPHPSNLKVYHINYESKVKKASSLMEKIISFLIFYIMIPISIIILFFSTNCIDPDISSVNIILNEKLYGQSVATMKIVETLQSKHNNKLIILYGGTGVGKTYAASLIFKDLWHCTNVYHYTMPTFKNAFSTSMLHGLGICNSAYMVVDDLNPDMDLSQQISDVFSKSMKFNTNLTVMLIYNSTPKETGFLTNYFFHNDEESLLLKLKQSFSKINVLQVYIKFHRLTKDHLRKCMESSLGGKKITDELFEELSRNFDVTSDGCKGVGSKMKFLNVKV